MIETSLRRLLLAISIALPLVLGSIAQAEDAKAPDDLSGVWTIDSEASDPMEDVMRLQGISWVERRAASGMSMTLTIEQTGRDIRQTASSIFVNFEKVFRMNDTEYADEDFRGNKMRSRDRWNSEGHFERTMVFPDGRQMHVLRELSDSGRTIVEHIRARGADGEEARARRVFRRQ